MFARSAGILLMLAIASGCAATHAPRREMSDLRFEAASAEPNPSETVLEIHFGDGLSEDEAIALGLENSEAFARLLADLGVSPGDSGESRPRGWEAALRAPQDAATGFTTEKQALSRSNPELDAWFELDGVPQRFENDGLNVVRRIRMAYIDLRLTRRRAILINDAATYLNTLARSAASTQFEHRDESSLLRTETLQIAADVRQVEADEQSALERLASCLGLLSTDVALRHLAGDEPKHLQPPSDVNSLVDMSLASRPDLRALELSMQGAENKVLSAQASTWPSMPWSDPPWNSGWLAVRPASGSSTNESPSVERAERLRRQLVSRRELVARQVRQAYSKCRQAERELSFWRDEILPKAEVAFDVADNAVFNSNVSLASVLEAFRNRIDAKLNVLELEADLQRACAALECAVGRKLVQPNQAVPL